MGNYSLAQPVSSRQPVVNAEHGAQSLSLVHLCDSRPKARRRFCRAIRDAAQQPVAGDGGRVGSCRRSRRACARRA